MLEEKHLYSDSEGNNRYDSGFVAHNRLRIDGMKWLAARLVPQRYGDKQELELKTGECDRLKEEVLAVRAQLAKEKKRAY